MVLSDPGWKRGWEVAEVREAHSLEAELELQAEQFYEETEGSSRSCWCKELERKGAWFALSSEPRLELVPQTERRGRGTDEEEVREQGMGQTCELL